MLNSNPGLRYNSKILVTDLNKSIPALAFTVPAGCYAEMTLTMGGTVSGSTMPLAILYLGGTNLAYMSLRIVPSSTIGSETLKITLDEGTYNFNSTATGWSAGGGNLHAYGVCFKKN